MAAKGVVRSLNNTLNISFLHLISKQSADDLKDISSEKIFGENYPRGNKNFERALQSNMMMQNHTEEIILKEL